MKNINSLLLILLITCSFGCSKEKENIVEEKKYNVGITINAEGAISEYKIFNSVTKKVLVHKLKPKPSSVRPGNVYNYITYNEYIDLASKEKLTIQVPVNTDLKSFGLNVGGNYFNELREDTKLKVYYIDFEAPKQKD